MPSNIAVDEECSLKISDFTSARSLMQGMTGYVANRFFRAPEIMLNWNKNDASSKYDKTGSNERIIKIGFSFIIQYHNLSGRYWNTLYHLLLVYSVDLWSVGCIMAEMITGKILFPGKNRKFIFYFKGLPIKKWDRALKEYLWKWIISFPDIDQLNRIIELCGTPAEWKYFIPLSNW